MVVKNIYEIIVDLDFFKIYKNLIVLVYELYTVSQGIVRASFQKTMKRKLLRFT